MGPLKRLSLLWSYLKYKDRSLRDFAIGMSSEVNISQDLHILFMDFDIQDQELVESSILESQSFWNLSDCFLYKTRNGFHAYFFYDIMPYSRVVMILNYTKYVDDRFRYISRYYDYKTIRQAGKYKDQDISFLKVLYGKREPTDQELELGDMKRKERGLISNMSGILQKDKLKA
jgi:hypothetical protein